MYNYNKIIIHDYLADGVTAALQLVVNTLIITIAAVYNSSVAVLEPIVETLTNVASGFWNPVVSTVYFGM